MFIVGSDIIDCASLQSNAGGSLLEARTVEDVKLANLASQLLAAKKHAASIGAKELPKSTGINSWS